MSEKEKERCGDCKFFAIDPQNLKQGFCRNEPPKLLLVPQPNGQIGFMASQPGVQMEGWCGRFEEKKVIL